MPDPRKETQLEQETMSERMSPIPLQPADSPAPAAAEIDIAPSDSNTEPDRWVYQTLHVLSIGSLVFMALSTRYWVQALQWFVWQKNPIKAGRQTWMFEVLCLASAHLGILFFAVSAGLGIWIGTTWQKARQNPSVLQEQV